MYLQTVVGVLGWGFAQTNALSGQFWPLRFRLYFLPMSDPSCSLHYTP